MFDTVKVDWCLVTGQPLSGKTTVTTTLKKHLGASRVTVVDWREHEAQVKATLDTPDAPFEGKVPLAKIEDSILALIKRDKKASRRVTYVFDGFPGQ